MRRARERYLSAPMALARGQADQRLGVDLAVASLHTGIDERSRGPRSEPSDHAALILRHQRIRRADIHTAAANLGLSACSAHLCRQRLRNRRRPLLRGPARNQPIPATVMRRISKSGGMESVCQGAGSPEVPLVRTMSHGYKERAGDHPDENYDQHADESPTDTHTRNVGLSEDRLDPSVSSCPQTCSVTRCCELPSSPRSSRR
jgi:hypothetical protein